jgi:predicted DNA-binding transcriptional regulator YafY
VWEEERVEIRYRKPEGEVKRLLDPLGLVLKAGVWYLVALSGRSRSLRTFRVSRVLSVRSLGEESIRPDDFDLAAHWAEAQAGFLGSWQLVPVLVRMHRDSMWMVRYVQDPTRREAALDSASAPDVEGWVTLTLQFENHDIAGYELMRLGADVEVLEPVELRQTMATRAASMVARYAAVPA